MRKLLLCEYSKFWQFSSHSLLEIYHINKNFQENFMNFTNTEVLHEIVNMNKAIIV